MTNGGCILLLRVRSENSIELIGLTEGLFETKIHFEYNRN